MNLFDPQTEEDERAEALAFEAIARVPRSRAADGNALTVDQVATALGVSKQRVYKLISDGRIAARKGGPAHGTAAQTLVDPADLEAFIAAPKGSFPSEESPGARRAREDGAQRDERIVELLHDLISEVRTIKQFVAIGGHR